ncbi:DegT/DnrJ/EryC1/StrS aminotransferase family protein [Sphingomonas sp. HF-S4]|uniref:DegT/DnrJ/EryC1/StrS aminotransferase family protein n=1 Tax=Sphingomonas agrestis TaxID=3080540 RepID=A0ABU3YBA9_9SPHN|nr:DegT/DnrJ/EryC1/StrS aminotransferase family protein [Sphingomonas sp. HF-S4]MDV3458453.1 DegT/DnrJ/EryC1/StrS aminotransferase family protein [Sphingomonas sp. HF-S4]
MIGSKSIWPSFTEEEADAVAAVIRSNRVNYWTGEIGRAFEREFAVWTGSSRAVALANGTLALDVALKALGIGAGDEVIVTPRTFIASISCVVNAGATPIFADVDRDSGNISAATIEGCITDRTRAIIPVHLAGWPCDMDAIMELANRHGIAVIEDCAQAHGARVGDRSVGSIGHVGAWSFCQDKIMTTGGEGGMVTTNDPALWSSMWSFKDHGKSWEAVYERTHPPGFRWVHDSFGTNWRMLEVQAAIGRIQLGRVASWTLRRTEIAMRFAEALAPFESAVRAPLPGPKQTHAFYRFYAYVRPEGLAPDWSRDRIVEALVAEGVQVLHGTCSEVYLEKAFDGTPFKPVERLPIARELGETSLMFLTHPTMEDAELDRAVTAIRSVLTKAAK